MAQGIGGGFNAFVTSIFLDTSNNTTALSVTGGIIVVFAKVIVGELKSRNIGEDCNVNTEIII